MRNIEYFHRFKEDMKNQGIEVLIDRNGVFKVSNELDFRGLSETETIGLSHILGYNYIKIEDNEYQLLKKLEHYSIEELEEEYEEGLLDEI